MPVASGSWPWLPPRPAPCSDCSSPASTILIAITRHRLYEIDTLINRTLVYVPLVGIVAGFYAASVALLQRVFVAFTGNTSDGAAVISALILAAIFTPVRKSIEGFVDRRFKPLPADAAAEERPGVALNDPAFVSAVERVVNDVLARRAEPLQGAHGRTPVLDETREASAGWENR
ncbi:MAG TPA: hypothetical protein VMP86_06300 [Candidatus Binatia bacterium]|nr:hypothetical protein [Candidatus Binatia bacterium]